MNKANLSRMDTTPRTVKSRFLAVAALIVGLVVFARPVIVAGEPSLAWFNSYFDTRTTLVYGIQDTDYYPLYFECETGRSDVNIGIEHEAVKIKHGDWVDVELASGGHAVSLSGLVYYQPMYDLSKVETHMPFDAVFRQLLAENGVLTITIEGQSFNYPLNGISGPASQLMAVCGPNKALATVPDGQDPNKASLQPQQSIDCKTATQQIDAMICRQEHLTNLHTKMVNVFKYVVDQVEDAAVLTNIQAQQNAWRAERDQRCALSSVTPVLDNEEDMDPQEYGQLICLARIYPVRITQLMDIVHPPLTPVSVTVLPAGPLQDMYKDRSGHLIYEAAYSPDGSLLAVGVEGIIGSGTSQVWLFDPKANL